MAQPGHVRALEAPSGNRTVTRPRGRMKFPWQKKADSVEPRRIDGSFSSSLYRALIDIRDNPKGAKQKAKTALIGPALWRYLYRALREIRRNPQDGSIIADRAIADARLAGM